MILLSLIKLRAYHATYRQMWYFCSPGIDESKFLDGLSRTGKLISVMLMLEKKGFAHKTYFLALKETKGRDSKFVCSQSDVSYCCIGIYNPLEKKEQEIRLRAWCMAIR